MIQSINAVKFNNYSTKTNFKAKVQFSGFYDPACSSHIPPNSKPPMDMFGTIKYNIKKVAESIKEKLSRDLPSDAKEVILVDDESSALSNVLKSVEKKKESASLLDTSNFVNESTGLNTHILPDGTPVTYGISSSTKLVDDGLHSGMKILDANNLLSADNKTLTHILPDGSSIKINMDEIMGDDVAASDIIESAIDKISEVIDAVFQ